MFTGGGGQLLRRIYFSYIYKTPFKKIQIPIALELDFCPKTIHKGNMTKLDLQLIAMVLTIWLVFYYIISL